MEEKWKASKKLEASSSSSHHSLSSKSSSFFSRSSSARSSSSKAPLLRSFSQKQPPSANLSRTCSHKNSSSIGHKCSSLAKEHKARFYIMRRCVAMLVCWHKHGDSS